MDLQYLGKPTQTKWEKIKNWGNYLEKCTLSWNVHTNHLKILLKWSFHGLSDEAWDSAFLTRLQSMVISLKPLSEYLRFRTVDPVPDCLGRFSFRQGQGHNLDLNLGHPVEPLTCVQLIRPAILSLSQGGYHWLRWMSFSAKSEHRHRCVLGRCVDEDLGWKFWGGHEREGEFYSEQGHLPLSELLSSQRGTCRQNQFDTWSQPHY